MNFDHFSNNIKFLILTHGVFKTLKFLLKIFNLQLKKNRSYYQFVNWKQLGEKKKSNKVFILGSGYSLNDIKASEWEKIGEHDVIGFNSTVRQSWVRVDYHIIRGWAEGANIYIDFSEIGKNLASFINNNKYYKDTILLLQNDFFGIMSHILLNKKFLKRKTKIFNYYTLNSKTPVKNEYFNRFCHLSGTLSDATHFALNMGWKEVVLVGVDLYDARYFWLKKNETFAIDNITGKRRTSEYTDRGKSYKDEHSTIDNGVEEEFKIWNKIFNENNSKLMVYNKKSLLNKVLKIYE